MMSPGLNCVSVDADRDRAASLLGRIGVELSSLAEAAADLQITLSPALMRAARSDARLIAGVQTLDLLAQSLANISRLLAYLDEASPPLGTPMVRQALDTIVLGDLKRRLGAAGSHDADASTTSGFELF